MKFTILPKWLFATVVLMAGSSLSFAQTTTSQSEATYTDGSASGFSLSLGQTYRINMDYTHSYVGFNIKPLNTGNWNVGTDGGSNGGAMIVGNMGGGLRFITVAGVNSPTPGGLNPPQTLYDSDLINSTRMSISNDGKVKIGPTAPTGTHSNYLLSVDGKLVTKSAYVTTQNWADFVFEPTYQRLTLPALEHYLQLNKHLPNVPSAKEVEANGYSLGDMDAKLLQSVEELTLHVIELNKQNEQLKARTAALEQRLAAAHR